MNDAQAAAWERWAARYARVALAAAFLSAVAGRFGLWGGHIRALNAFMPASTAVFLAWAATIVETSLALALIAGVQTRWAAAGSAVLLAWFGTAMAIADGPKSPLDYSVFSASAAALLLALYEARVAHTARSDADGDD
jgi:putative oxidoreductase